MEITKFEEVICVCLDQILSNLKLSDLKLLRLTNVHLNNICAQYMYEKRFVKLIIDERNHEILWRNDSPYKIKTFTLAVNWRYAYNRYLTIPNQFLNISKLLLSIDVGSDLITFDVLFQQLPQLKYFGFLLNIETINCNLWNTQYCYPNLNTLEIGTIITKNLKYLNTGSVINFIRRHPNIHSLHVNLSLLRNLSIKLRDENITIENLYIHWDDYYTHLYYDSILHIFNRWFEWNLYKNIYLEFLSNSEKSYLFFSNGRNIQGIRDLHHLKLDRPKMNKLKYFFQFPSPSEIKTNNSFVKTIYKSEWFNFNFR